MKWYHRDPLRIELGLAVVVAVICALTYLVR
jgi:hypothetical protein